MTVTVYRSTDASAPTLNGTAGSLIALLDAVLVNGYGAKPALGWTKAFSGTNTASYKQPAGTTNGFYLDVDDNNPNVDSNKTARVRGYETMTAVATGTNPFPTTAQLATALQWGKSSEATSSTPVVWTIVGTNKFFYYWVRHISTNVTAPGGDVGLMAGFGDFLSYKVGDVYNTFINGITTAGASAISSSGQYGMGEQATNAQTATTGHYVARSYTQLGASIAVGKISDYAKCPGAPMGYSPSQSLSYPNGPDSALYTAPVWISEATTRHLRGVLPGLYAPLHNLPLNTGDTFTGAVGSPLAGKTLEAFSTGYSTGAGAFGQVMLEVSNTW